MRQSISSFLECLSLSKYHNDQLIGSGNIAYHWILQFDWLRTQKNWRHFIYLQPGVNAVSSDSRLFSTSLYPLKSLGASLGNLPIFGFVWNRQAWSHTLKMGVSSSSLLGCQSASKKFVLTYPVVMWMLCINETCYVLDWIKIFWATS